MKVSGKKGIIIVLVFLIFIPLLLDIFFAIAFPELKLFDFSITKYFVGDYVRLLPYYVSYTIIVFVVIYLFTDLRKKRKSEKINDHCIDAEERTNRTSE